MVIGIDILTFNTFITGLLSAQCLRIIAWNDSSGGCNVTTGIGIGTQYRHRWRSNVYRYRWYR